MVDSVDVDDALFLVDPVDDAIRPDSRAVPAFELPAERVPDSVRVSNQTAEAELDDGPYDSWGGSRETVEMANRGWRPTKPVLIHGTSGPVPPPW